jgi:DNA-binding SARP family transcriptional activator
MLRLLGPPTHKGTGSFPQRGYEVLAVLTLVPGAAVNRKTLASLIWGEASDERALGNLRYVLHAIRQWSSRNDYQLIQNSSDELMKIDRPISDLDEFLSAPPPETVDGLRAYAAEFAPELLDGISASAQDFERWLQAHRSRLQQLFVDNVLRSAAHLTGEAV